MPNKYKKEHFQIESFRPLRLQEARKALERHVHRVQMHAHTNEDYKKGILKEKTMWEKLSGFFKR